MDAAVQRGLRTVEYLFFPGFYSTEKSNRTQSGIAPGAQRHLFCLSADPNKVCHRRRRHARMWNWCQCIHNCVITVCSCSLLFVPAATAKEKKNGASETTEVHPRTVCTAWLSVLIRRQWHSFVKVVVWNMQSHDVTVWSVIGLIPA